MYPPPDAFELPIVHKITQLYSTLYPLGRKIPKRDRFGLHSKIEQLGIEILSTTIEAALLPRERKLPKLEQTRLAIELLKRLIRLEQELKIIEEPQYVRLVLDLQELSRMTTGWIKYTQKEP